MLIIVVISNFFFLIVYFKVKLFKGICMCCVILVTIKEQNLKDPNCINVYNIFR